MKRKSVQKDPQLKVESTDKGLWGDSVNTR